MMFGLFQLPLSILAIGAIAITHFLFKVLRSLYSEFLS